MAAAATPLLSVRHVRKHFAGRRLFGRKAPRIHAVDDVSFDVARGETFGLVGESGCGKSTLARCIVRLLEPSEGEVLFDGRDIAHLTMGEMRPLRRALQLVFQDPIASLNPRKRVGRIVVEALEINGIGTRAERPALARVLFVKVGLAPDLFERYPSGLSGGQRQRVGIARALALAPKLMVADEPVSALDVSVRAEILNLLKDLQDELGLTMLFISHDLGVIRHISDRVGVMYLGKLVELSPADAFFEAPFHPYSEALLSAIPLSDPDARLARKQIVLEGDMPNPAAPPAGCRFNTRCLYATDLCRRVEPPLAAYPGGRLAACHYPLNQNDTMPPPSRPAWGSGRANGMT
jgi:oligopeptide/dipeptide ABC transporter ATP-binding protein